MSLPSASSFCCSRSSDSAGRAADGHCRFSIDRSQTVSPIADAFVERGLGAVGSSDSCPLAAKEFVRLKPLRPPNDPNVAPAFRTRLAVPSVPRSPLGSIPAVSVPQRSPARGGIFARVCERPFVYGRRRPIQADRSSCDS
jgi:hypothetical protein